MQLTEKDKFDAIISIQENMKSWHASLSEAPTLMQVHARFYDLIASHNAAPNSKTGVLPAGAMPPSEDEMIAASLRLAPWLAAAIDDPDVCDEYKQAISGWFNTSMPTAIVDLFHSKILDANAILEEEVENMQARLDAKETRNKMLLSELDALSARYFYDGVPPAHFGKEWFIAVMDDGDRVVLRSLDEENAYDYTTMDATYFKAYRIKKWMQFPDSQYITYSGASPPNQIEAPQMLGDDYVHTIASLCGMYEQHDNAKPSADTVIGFANALYDAIMSNAAIHAAAKVKL